VPRSRTSDVSLAAERSCPHWHCWLRAVAVVICLASVLASTLAGCGDSPTTPLAGVDKPAFVLTNMARLADILGKGDAAKVAALASRFGDVHDLDAILGTDYAGNKSAILADEPQYAATIDAIVEKRFGKDRYSCILVLGGQGVVPMSQMKNPLSDLKNGTDGADTDILYSDDVYGDFDHDTLTTPDVPVARIPDGKSFKLMEAQLKGTGAPASGGLVLYNQVRSGAPQVGKVFSAGRNDAVPPTKDTTMDPGLRYYFFILHGGPTSDFWSGDDPSGKGQVVGLRAKNASATGIVFSAACYGGYMIDEKASGDIGLHFLESRSRSYVASTGTSYSWDANQYAEAWAGGLAKLFFQNCVAGSDPLLAYFDAKCAFAAKFANTDSTSVKILHEYNYFGLPVVAAATTATSTASPQPAASSGDSDTELVMDVSGSMGDEMSGVVKLDAAKSAADSIVSMIRNESMTQSGSNAVGLVSFTTEAQVDQPLGADYAGTTQAIAAMTPQDSTNLGDGLEKALGSLYGAARTRERMIIVLSDGQSNAGMSNEEILSGPVARAASAGIKIYTVGFGDSGDIDEDLLNKIADRTGGEYYFANEAFKLQNIYIALRHKSGGTILGDYNGTSASTGKPVGAFSVDAVTGELHGTLNTEGGDARVVLKDPDGRSVGGDYPGAILFEDSKPAYVIVKNPQPGNWRAYVQTVGGGTVTYDVIVSARGTHQPVDTYTTLLSFVVLSTAVLALGLIAVFRWPIRSPRE